MTDPMMPPAKKNPQKRTQVPSIPPGMRSRAALGLSAAAAEGRFTLQVCGECARVQYPPRDACGACLSVNLDWRDVPRAGELLAETKIRTTTDLYFRERMPWRMGSVKLEAGPVVLCHVHGDVAPHAAVRMALMLDRAGQGVMLALPISKTPNMMDDPQMRAMSCDPKYRRVLITDGRNPAAPALARGLLDAGASDVFVGVAERWRADAALEAIKGVAGVEIVPLDVTDTTSVMELAGELGGKTDILINTARFLRPGGIIARGDVAFARDEIEVNYLGLMRLAQAFGPALCARAADGDNAATAWVNLLSAYSLMNSPDFGCFSASHAGALSLSQSLRSEFHTSGIRVMNVFVGPTEDEWHQHLPPPKVQPNALARSVVQGLQEGLEDVYCGDVAKDLKERLQAGGKVLEREMTLSGGGV